MIKKFLLITAICVSMVGCGTETATRPHDTSIAHSIAHPGNYGESVFRLQNAVLDDLITEMESHANRPDLNSAVLTEAEDRIVNSCRDLNEAASISAAGHEPSLLLKLRALNSLAECESSAKAVKAEMSVSSAVLSASSP